MVQCAPQLDTTFTALSDPTRRGILERLGRRDASISDLAATFEITLTGIKKHVQILERSGLVTTQKVGRVRNCRLGPRRLEDEAAWIARYRQMLDARLNRLGEFLERTKGSQP
jgi:DNA-binding transcriptional ArsR family regulator